MKNRLLPLEVGSHGRFCDRGRLGGWWDVGGAGVQSVQVSRSGDRKVGGGPGENPSARAMFSHFVILVKWETKDFTLFLFNMY